VGSLENWIIATTREQGGLATDFDQEIEKQNQA
jgi:hypothetical protein